MQSAHLSPSLAANLPEELLLHVTSFLDVSSLITMRTINKNFYVLCSNNDAGWTNLCHDLWKDKIFVCSQARALLPTAAMQAYRASLHDSRARQGVRPDEEFYFCPEQETGPIWHFRFKEAAGPDWTSWDPWWNGRYSRKMVFLRDGSICQYLEKDEDYQHDLLLRNPAEFGRPLPLSGNLILDPPVSMKWRFCERPMDLPVRDRGSYLRLSVGGRDVPTYVVRRSPTKNWGFIAESCWGVYASFEMPLQRVDAGPTTRMDTTADAVMAGSDSAPITTASSRSKDAGEGSSPLLSDDSSFIITNEVQWREALLYNFGATILPEGDTATEDFDRMFGQTLQHRAAVGAAAGGVVAGILDPQQQRPPPPPVVPAHEEGGEASARLQGEQRNRSISGAREWVNAAVEDDYDDDSLDDDDYDDAHFDDGDDLCDAFGEESDMEEDEETLRSVW